MKLSLIIICGFIISSGCSQTIKIEKGYAYERSIISGVKPIQGISEDGIIVQRNGSSGKQYLIYISTKDTGQFDVKEIWIKGEKYVAEAGLVNDRPVIVPRNLNAANTNDTLFSSSGLKIWKIDVGSLLPAATNINKPQNLNENEVLIGYLPKQKLRYFSITKIIQIQSIPLQ